MGKYIRIALLLVLLTCNSCITIVKNRKFAGEDKLIPAFGDWRIGIPKAVDLDQIVIEGI